MGDDDEGSRGRRIDGKYFSNEESGKIRKEKLEEFFTMLPFYKNLCNKSTLSQKDQSIVGKLVKLISIEQRHLGSEEHQKHREYVLK